MSNPAEPTNKRIITRPVITIETDTRFFCFIFLIVSIAQFERLGQPRVACRKKVCGIQAPQKQKRQRATDRQEGQKIQNINLESARMNERQDGHIRVNNVHTKHPIRDCNEKPRAAFRELEEEIKERNKEPADDKEGAENIPGFNV